jgi:hypothetical protein
MHHIFSDGLMKKFFLILACTGVLLSGVCRADVARENIVISGGVSLHKWEMYRPDPHDNWWMNFVRAARIRIQQLREADPQARITWLVYRPAYERRCAQEGRDLLGLIDSVRDAYGVNRVYFSSTAELVAYLNTGGDRSRVKISNLEYFGHSNKACWMFDYSNFVDGASKAWLHEDELSQLQQGIFAADAFVKSWGCHTGESMSQVFRRLTGIRMWGAVGKTQYQTDELPKLSGRWGRWKA